MKNYEVQSIRQQCIDTYPQLLEQAKNTLTAKGCVVYLAKDSDEAISIITQLCPSEQRALCTFSTELEEIQLKKAIPQVIQTDLEAIVAEGIHQPYVNPRCAPLEHATSEQITEILGQYLQTPTEGTLLQAISRQIKVEADKADWGITGLDGIAADTGTIILAEDQGNGRLVSNIPTRHLAIIGLEKIYPSNESVLETIHTAWTTGGRQNSPVYYSYITGPSRTGDIEGAMVCGMHGPLAVHVILLDNGRSKLLSEHHGQVLRCIECGQCTAALQELMAGQQIPAPLTCKSLALAYLKTPFQISSERWNACNFQCPVGIQKEDLQNIIQ